MADQQQDNLSHHNMVMVTRVVILLLACLTLVICSLRLVTRRFVVKAFGWDDFLVIWALILVLGFASLGITITYYGAGKHTWDVAEEDLLRWLKGYYVALCIYLSVASTVKTSLLVFLMRVFPNVMLHRICKTLIGFLVVFCISGTFPLAFKCSPVQASYDPTLPQNCFSSDVIFALTMYQGIIMFCVDVIIIVLPMPQLWKLNMPLKKRLLMMVLFGCGSIATIASLVRFSTLAYTKDSTDFTYSSASSLIWMNVEFCLGLTAGSLSSILPLFKGGQGSFSSSKNSQALPNTSKQGGNGYIRQQDYEMSGRKQGFGNRDINKSVTIDVEVQSTESTEHIINNSHIGIRF